LASALLITAVFDRFVSWISQSLMLFVFFVFEFVIYHNWNMFLSLSLAYFL
jgi:hypothetical protein